MNKNAIKTQIIVKDQVINVFRIDEKKSLCN